MGKRIDEVVKIFSDATQPKSSLSSLPPVLPKAGEIYLFSLGIYSTNGKMSKGKRGMLVYFFLLNSI